MPTLPYLVIIEDRHYFADIMYYYVCYILFFLLSVESSDATGDAIGQNAEDLQRSTRTSAAASPLSIGYFSINDDSIRCAHYTCQYNLFIKFGYFLLITLGKVKASRKYRYLTSISTIRSPNNYKSCYLVFSRRCPAVQGASTAAVHLYLA